MSQIEIPEDLKGQIEAIHEAETNYEPDSFREALETLVSLSEEALSNRAEFGQKDYSDLFET